MPPIVSHIEIARPPEEVFAYITDPSRFPEWQHDVVRVDLQGNGLAGVGARFTTTRRLGVGLPRFDGQGRWLGQAACWMTSSWAAVSNSLGVR
jgi:Polyketide cyclase / dehydrase and lipid transport